jgi:hypothetical protein
LNGRRAALALALSFAAGSTAAQASWSAGGRIVLVEHRIEAGFGAERYSGFGLGVEGARRLSRRVSVTLAAQGTQLRSATAGELDRRMGEIDLRGRLAMASWWGFYGGLTARAIASDASREHWMLGRVGAEIRTPFTGGTTYALARLGVIPVATVSGLDNSSFAFDGGVGVEYGAPRVTFGLLYALERFEFPRANGLRRVEQVSSLLLRASLRLTHQ